jgi:hypothetical protein
MSKSPLINGKLPNGKWRWKEWPPHEWVLIIGDYAFSNNGIDHTNTLWVDDEEKTGWTKIESIVEVYYKKL